MGWIHPHLPILPASPNQGISPSTLQTPGGSSAARAPAMVASCRRRLLMVIYASALVASKLPVQLLSSRWYLVDAERSRLQAFQNQQQLISQPGLRRRLASERRQRLIQLPAGPGRHRATAAKAKGRRSAAR
jgi:hypothetical protein